MDGVRLREGERRNSSQAPEARRLQFENIMKNKEAMAVFLKHVSAKVRAAESMGIKASWQTRDHLGALAEVLAVVPKGENVEAEFRELLEDCYNISGFAQMLEKVPALKEKGHFQRDAGGGGKRATTVDEISAMLQI